MLKYLLKEYFLEFLEKAKWLFRDSELFSSLKEFDWTKIDFEKFDFTGSTNFFSDIPSFFINSS